jgi:hypothetical protein
MLRQQLRPDRLAICLAQAKRREGSRADGRRAAHDQKTGQQQSHIAREQCREENLLAARKT